MPSVPYDPVPKVAPVSGGTPYLHPNVPEAAFGAQIGRAQQGFGQTLQHAGETLANDVLFAQGLKNEADTNVAVTGSLQETGVADNEFRLKVGSQADGEALKAHTAHLQEIREKWKATLSNPMAQKMFDRETMRRMSYDIINAGHYSATEMKKFAKQSAASKRDAMISDVMKDPYNDRLFDDTFHSLVNSTAVESTNLDGDPVEETDRRTKIEVGKLVGARAGALAKHDPAAAQKLYDRFKDKLTPLDQDRIQETITDRGIKTNSAVWSARIMGPGSNLVDQRAVGKGVRTELLSPEMRSRGSEAIAAAEAATGQKASIESAARTNAEQAVLYARYRSGQGGLAAPPGQSRHEIGEAIDLQDGPVLAKLREWYKSGELKEKYGLEMLPDSANDPGHLQLAAGRKPYEARSAAFDGTEQSLADKFRQAEVIAEREYPLAKDAAVHERFVNQLQHDISTKASFQNKMLADERKALTVNLGTILNQRTEAARGPISMEQANGLDSTFQDKYERLGKIIGMPQADKFVNNWFKANANQDNPETHERRQNYMEWVGKSTEDRMSYDANDAFNKGQIIDGDRIKVLQWQAQTKHTAEDTVKADSILNRHRTVTDALKAFPSKTNKEANTRYERIRGALILELRDAQAGGIPVKKPEDEDRIMDKLAGQMETGRNTRIFGIPIPGTTETKPMYESRSLQYPVTIMSAADRSRLRSGQVYIFNGHRAIKQ